MLHIWCIVKGFTHVNFGMLILCIENKINYLHNQNYSYHHYLTLLLLFLIIEMLEMYEK
jgi:hypothetical protein